MDSASPLLLAADPLASPESYIKLTHKLKAIPTLIAPLFLSQEIPVSPENAIWCLQFSHDGKYLAVAGEAAQITVFKVISSPLDRLASQNHTSAKHPCFAPLLDPNPMVYLQGHTNDILSLDWSKNGFLLSSSSDRTVRLWHPQAVEPSLAVFPHKDFVTCTSFHPTDDRFFASGSLDKTLRLWSILDSTVCYEAVVPEMITACAFFPDGSTILAGTINGIVYGFDTSGLDSKFQFDLRKGYVKNSGAAKISGLECFEASGEVRVLVTTGDSRVRVYSCSTLKILEKFKGLENITLQASATVSGDHSLIAAASDDHSVYLWQAGNGTVKHNLFRKNNAGSDCRVNAGFSSFHAHKAPVSAVSFVPERAKRLLCLSNDPIYDLNQALADAVRFTPSNSSVSSSSTSDWSENSDLVSLIHPLKFHCLVTCDTNGLLRCFRADTASQIRKAIRERTKKKSHGDNSTAYIDPFVDFILNSLGQAPDPSFEDMPPNNTSKHKGAPYTSESADDSTLNPTSQDFRLDQTLTSEPTSATNEGSLEQPRRRLFSGSGRRDTFGSQNSLPDQNSKNQYPAPLTKNNSFYSIGNSSISSLLRGRSESDTRSIACEVCQGTSFFTRTSQYKGTNKNVRVCQDCGNEVK